MWQQTLQFKKSFETHMNKRKKRQLCACFLVFAYVLSFFVHNDCFLQRQSREMWLHISGIVMHNVQLKPVSYNILLRKQLSFVPQRQNTTSNSLFYFSNQMSLCFWLQIMNKHNMCRRKGKIKNRIFWQIRLYCLRQQILLSVVQKSVLGSISEMLKC